MKRSFCLIVLFLCTAAALSGCLSGTSATGRPNKENTPSASGTQYFDAPAETRTPSPESPQTLLRTYTAITLELPAWWSDLYEETVSETRITFSSTKSKTAGYGGTVFALALFDDTAYEELPAYEVLGTVSDSDRRRTLVVLYPTDVQFVQEDMETYTAMTEDIPAILRSISAADGYAYIPTE